MTYPTSSDVSAGQPTASAHYNNLRKDALLFGQSPADSRLAGDFLGCLVLNMNLAVNPGLSDRIQCVYDSQFPPSVVIDQCLLVNTTHVYSPSHSGSAGVYYIFANRAPAATTFTLTLNASPTVSAAQRLIGEAYWSGTAFAGVLSYRYNAMPAAHYDSGWFAVTTTTAYTKAHNLGSVPRFFIVYHSTASDGSSENVIIGNVMDTTHAKAPIGFTAVNAYYQSGADATSGTCYSTRRFSNAGYIRILAWK
jgi:hypothetical protein